MPWRALAQVIVSGSQAVARAFGRALQQEIKSSRQAAASQQASSSTNEKTAGQQTRRTAATNARHGISLQEAVQILNVSKDLSPEEVEQSYEHLFKANEKSSGGSFYLQSKVFRAKERIDVEIRSRQAKETENSAENTADTKSDSPPESKRDSS